MKKIFILFLIMFLFTSCYKTYIVYCKDNRGPYYVRLYHYSEGIPEAHINALDIDSVRLVGDTTNTEYKYR